MGPMNVLSDEYIKSIVTPWGPIGYTTYKRTYARRFNENDPNSATEEFEDTINRIITGCNKQLKIGFTKEEEAELRFYFLTLKGSTAGRFLWQLGTKTVDRLGLLSLQNCAFTLVNEPIRPFTWAMDALMLGSGVGYNIQREHVYELPKVRKAKIIRQDTNDADYIVPDSRAGWVDLLQKVLEAHFVTGKGFSYSTVCVRSKGAVIKGFGGLASGAEELCFGMGEINKVLNARAGKKARPIDCLDIMNIIGYIVVSGNVRRSAQIAIGDMDDLQFLNAKRWDLGNIPSWRAMSNNSVVCNDFSQLPDQIWDGYNGTGEPYGFINLANARKMGRVGEIQYPDLGVQGFNPCVSGDTEILTDNGYEEIQNLVDIEVNIWNGFEWSKVIPKITGNNQEMVNITFSDGRLLKCTKYHKFHISTTYDVKKNIIVNAEDLEIGMKLIKNNFPIVEHGTDLPDAYTQGFVSAEGMELNRTINVYKPKEMCLKRLQGIKMQKWEENNARYRVVLIKTPVSKSYVPFENNLYSKMEWLSGLFDGDGCELKEGGLQLVSVNREFLANLQKMLSTVGVQSKITPGTPAGFRSMPDHKGGSAMFYCQESYRILIGAMQMQDLKKLGLNCSRMSFNKAPQRDASQFVRVTGIEDAGVEEIVYCFNEPKNHTGIFGGVITGQCAEQGLEDKETCCLAETFLPNIESFEELKKVLTYLYRICKHSLTLGCHLKETEAIVHKNMRMGIGITGYLQATEEQRNWLSDAYVYLRAFDVEYSAKHGFPESIKLTTMKPSGTLSLLAGTTAGAHPAFSRFYIRRMRIASNSNLIEVCRTNGYPMEFQRNFDGTEDKSTMVVSFPCSVPEGTKLAKDMTAVDQLNVIKRLQTEWSDNSVSVTIYYKKEELQEIKDWLSANYNDNIKTVSFLLHSDHGFIQAPMEEITEEQYLELKAKTTPITGVSFKEEDISGSDECSSGVCPIK